MLTFKQYLQEKKLFGEANITRRDFIKGAGAALLPGAARGDSETVLKNIGAWNAELNDQIRGHAAGHGSPLTLSDLNALKETDPERHSKYMENLNAFKNNRGGMHITNSDEEEKELYGKLHPSLTESTYSEADNNYMSGRGREISNQQKSDPRYVKGQTSQFNPNRSKIPSDVKGQTSQFNPNRSKIPSDVKNETNPFISKQKNSSYNKKRAQDRKNKVIDFSNKIKSFIANYRAN